MRYAGLIKNDFTAAPGVSVSFYTQGCPHHCPGCHNPETWDFNGGQEFTYETLDEIINALTANGVKRSLSILGGEPLCDENLFLTDLVVRNVKEKLPDVEIYIWTGFLYEQIKKQAETNSHMNFILSNSKCIVDGPFIEKERDITLPMCGSRNQRVIYLDKSENL